MKHPKICSLCLLLSVVLLAGCENYLTVKQGEIKTTDSQNSQTDLSIGTDSKENKLNVAKEFTDHFVIDVRSKEEWDDGHLETAIHIPHTEIVDGVKKVTDDKNAKIYLH